MSTLLHVVPPGCDVLRTRLVPNGVNASAALIVGLDRVVGAAFAGEVGTALAGVAGAAFAGC